VAINKDEDDLTKGVLQMGYLRLFMEVGIIYDPSDKKKDEKKDEKKEGPKAVPAE
jgi:hypothetical protein